VPHTYVERIDDFLRIAGAAPAGSRHRHASDAPPDGRRESTLEHVALDMFASLDLIQTVIDVGSSYFFSSDLFLLTPLDVFFHSSSVFHFFIIYSSNILISNHIFFHSAPRFTSSSSSRLLLISNYLFFHSSSSFHFFFIFSFSSIFATFFLWNLTLRCISLTTLILSTLGMRSCTHM